LNLPDRRSIRRLNLREAEVQDLGLPAFGDEDVGGLDVAVNDPLGVRRIQSIGKLDAKLLNLLRFNGLRGDAVFERLSFEKLHRDEGLALVLVDVVDGADVGVVEGGGGASLALEAFLCLVAGEQPLGQELERHLAAEAGVFGLVDHTHPPAAELLEDAVVRDSLADHDSPRGDCPYGATLPLSDSRRQPFRGAGRSAA